MLNWLARYAAVIDHVVDADGRARTSVLDVGCGPHGLACAVGGVPFVGVDVEFPQPVAPTMVGIRCRPESLPFRDGAFGVVLCLELTGPFQDLARHEASALRDAWVQLYRNACFGESGRKGWVLERIEQRVPLASHDDLEATAIAALRCPECDCAITVEGPDLLRCGSCALPVPRDGTRAWDLASPPAFFCAPAWRDGDVERLLRRFVDQRRGPASLVLYAPPEVIDGEAALRAAQAAFGDAPVPDTLDIAILDRALAPGELSALRATRTVLVA